MPAASFLALKTHLELIMFALGGGSSSTHVPAASSVASSSSIAFSHYSHLGLCFASASVRGSNASESDVSAMKVCSRPSKSSSKDGSLSMTTHTSPASSASLTNDPGISLLGIICRVVVCVGLMPALACSLQISHNGFRRCVEQRSWAGGGFCCFFTGSSFSLFLPLSSSYGMRLGVLEGVVRGEDVRAFGAAACSLCVSGASSSSPSSDADAPK